MKLIRGLLLGALQTLAQNSRVDGEPQVAFGWLCKQREPILRLRGPFPRQLWQLPAQYRQCRRSLSSEESWQLRLCAPRSYHFPSASASIGVFLFLQVRLSSSNSFSLGPSFCPYLLDCRG